MAEQRVNKPSMPAALDPPLTSVEGLEFRVLGSGFVLQG